MLVGLYCTVLEGGDRGQREPSTNSPSLRDSRPPSPEAHTKVRPYWL